MIKIFNKIIYEFGLSDNNLHLSLILGKKNEPQKPNYFINHITVWNFWIRSPQIFEFFLSQKILVGDFTHKPALIDRHGCLERRLALAFRLLQPDTHTWYFDRLDHVQKASLDRYYVNSLSDLFSRALYFIGPFRGCLSPSSRFWWWTPASCLLEIECWGFNRSFLFTSYVRFLPTLTPSSRLLQNVAGVNGGLNFSNL